MTDLLTEIKDELHSEKLHLAVRKYYKGAIALAVIIVVLTSIFVYRRESKITEQEELSKEYYSLFMSETKLGKIKESDFGKLTTFNKTIYSRFAKFQYVNHLVSNKEYGKAIQLLFDIIKESNNELEIANLAKIRAAELMMKYNMSSYHDNVLDLLQKATRNDDAPYFYMMKLILGRVLIEGGKQEEALDIFKSLSKDEKAPNNIKFFSNAILENYLN